jgi:hypothetical protein
MKTIKLLLFTALFLFVKSAAAFTPVTTSTLVNPCVPFVTITPIPNTYGCYSITTNNSVPNDPDAYYQWHFQDGTNGIGKVIFHCCSPVTVTTNYTLSLTYNSPQLCGPLPNVQVFTITLNPPSSTHCVLNTPSVSLSVNSVTVWAGVAIPEIITNYNYGDGSPTTNSYTHTYPACGNYIVQVNQWDMNTPNDTCYAYGAVNINCGNPSGIKDHSLKTNTFIYPNPTKDILNIKTTAPFVNVSVFDILGKEIPAHSEYQNTTGKIFVEDFLPGAYFIKIRFENGKQAYIKFIKE